MIDYKQGITVVIPFYNTEDYIEECLASVFAQSYIEDGGYLSVICVDDGSTDGSAIAVKEMFKFKNNVECHLLSHSMNKGLAAARNTGLENVMTKYVMFLDSDDLLSSDTINELHEHMERLKSDVGIFEYEYFSPSGTKWPRNNSVSLFNGQVYMVEQPSINLQIIQSLSACNKIYLSAALKDLRFDETNRFAEDIEYWFDLLSRSPKVAVINQEAKYFYRKREDTSNESIMDTGVNRFQSFFSYLSILERLERNFRNDEELYSSVRWFCQKTLFYYLSRIGLVKDNHHAYDQSDFFERARNLITKTQIDPRLPTYQKIAYKLLKRQLLKNAWPLSLLHKTKNSGKNLFERARRMDFRFFKRAYSSFSSKMIFETPKLLKFALTSDSTHNDTSVWLIGERGTGASDNGFAVFRQLDIGKCRNSKIDYFYVCSGDCYQALSKQYKNIVLFGSKEHVEVFRRASILVCSHSRGNIEPFKNKHLLRLLSANYRNKKFIFLGHGITKDNMEPMLGYRNKFNARFDLFWCGSKLEYRDVIARYGYPRNQVVLAPLPRWQWPVDTLDKTDINMDIKNVMIMFTWRSESGRSNRKDDSARIRFEKDFFDHIKEILSSSEIEALSKRYAAKFHFVLHPETEATLERFGLELPTSNFIQLQDTSQIPHLIKQCDLLITDYSSIAFDFAYYNKHTIYYQFDRSSFRKNHYQAGYFDYDLHGFGPVAVSSMEFYQEIEKYLTEQPHYFSMRRHINFQYMKKVSYSISDVDHFVDHVQALN